MIKKSIVIAIIAICVLASCSPAAVEVPEHTSRPATLEIYTAEAPAQEEAPQPTSPPQIGVINCPECEGIPLILWKEIDNIGSGGGKVNHGDTCRILEKDIWDGIPKFKLNCSGKIGWLRQMGVIMQ
jgi:hypothetical protein